jgi:hypothetical protein
MILAFFSSARMILLECHESPPATSHMRLRACDHYISSTLIGGNGGAGPSSLRSMLEGLMEYVNA